MKRCRWCKKVLSNQQHKAKLYCSVECNQKFGQIRSRIFNIFYGDDKAIDRELRKLDELGCHYTFPSQHEQLNAFYELRKNG